MTWRTNLWSGHKLWRFSCCRGKTMPKLARLSVNMLFPDLNALQCCSNHVVVFVLFHKTSPWKTKNTSLLRSQHMQGCLPLFTLVTGTDGRIIAHNIGLQSVHWHLKEPGMCHWFFALWDAKWGTHLNTHTHMYIYIYICTHIYIYLCLNRISLPFLAQTLGLAETHLACKIYANGNIGDRDCFIWSFGLVWSFEVSCESHVLLSRNKVSAYVDKFS